MRRIGVLRFSLVALLFLAGSTAMAQEDSLLVRYNNWRESALQEKLYAHLDRTFFLTGETLWFSLFYTDASFNLPLDISKVAYVEILDKTNKQILSVKVALSKGAGHGSVFFPASLSSGRYIFRAYTSLMKNYSADLFFQQVVTVVNPFTKLGLTDSIAAPTYDAQFFPEGGNLVSGITSKVGFRVVNKFGKGIVFKGAVVDELHDTVARFSPLGFGIGTFNFKPAAGHTYTAVVTDVKQFKTKIALPSVLETGYVISVADTSDNKVKIVVASNAFRSDEPYCYLLVHTRSTNIQSKRIYLSNGKGMLLLDKNSLGEGISHLMLFDAMSSPVCERLYFRRPATSSLTLQAGNGMFGKRKKVTLDINGDAIAGNAVRSHVSVSVYRLDSLQANDATDIRTWLWLTSELKGAIESPEFYLTDAASNGMMDNLMLTHGWVRFQWKDIANKQKQKLEFIPEYRGHIIAGRVKNLTPADQRKVIVYLSNPDKNIRLYPSRSTLDGKVQFELREFLGTRKLIIQTDTKIDSIYDLELESPFSAKTSSWKYPAFTISKDIASSVEQRSLHMQVQNVFHDVNNDKFRVDAKDTTAFYGVPDERYFLDDYTRFPTMEEVMREYITGVRVRNRRGNFHFAVLDNLNHKIFRDDPLVLLDGVPVFNINKIIAMDPLKIKKCEVMTRKYYLGPKSFDGIVSFTTYHGDMSDFVIDRRTLITDYEGLQLYREFFSPKYETEQQAGDRVPDARTLLYWNPDVRTDKDGKMSPAFYTSDIPGKYRVVVQALSGDGKPGTVSTVFDVK